ncbi:MAG: hypothetical protein IKD42_00990, partial [Kiritimatiellae bacterium]|nr:hypothetical protein [Kiritimatiellia bacterium]
MKRSRAARRKTPGGGAARPPAHPSAASEGSARRKRIYRFRRSLKTQSMPSRRQIGRIRLPRAAKNFRRFPGFNTREKYGIIPEPQKT